MVIADGGYRGTELVIPHRRERGQDELPVCKGEHNPSHCKAHSRVEHAFARTKSWKILRDCRLKAMASITPCLASPASTTSPSRDSRPERGRPGPDHSEPVRSLRDSL
ncbi:hypothetical protein GCM10010121_087240 [Streptomyces brasiliensis]|uniref:DDE Tnp4 domain-containing protein n=1 Tax=Streptomyces brasiliensis TaxID=1954 RepID=A0A917UK67_9ACTN|nr:hypothetical protein GCM10010121_087240 [Streptomyces brasiliensis]